MTREPQVGDVYKLFDFNFAIVSRYNGYCAVMILTKLGINQKIDICPPNYFKPDSLLGTITAGNGLLYQGKLAPRYKRLFGIYYIKDKSNDQ